MAVGFLVYFTLIIGTIVLRPIIVILHELGHAISALFLTKGDIVINIGEKLDKSTSWSFKVSRATFILNFRKLFVGGGYVAINKAELSWFVNIIIVLFGPLVTFIIGFGAFYFSLFYNLPGAIKIIFVFILGLSIVDLFGIFLYSISFYNGYYTFSDGAQLNLLILKKIFPYKINKALYEFHLKNYKSALPMMQSIIDLGFKDRELYFRYIMCLCYLDKFDEVIDFYKNDPDFKNLSSNQISEIGFFAIKKDFDRAKHLVYAANTINKDDNDILSNTAFTYLLDGNFKKSNSIFSYLISSGYKLSYCYANRGLAKILDGQINNGIGDINQSLNIDILQSYAYRSLGINQLNHKNYHTAIQYFRIAYKYDTTTFGIDELIDECLKNILGR